MPARLSINGLVGILLFSGITIWISLQHNQQTTDITHAVPDPASQSDLWVAPPNYLNLDRMATRIQRLPVGNPQGQGLCEQRIQTAILPAKAVAISVHHEGRFSETKIRLVNATSEPAVKRLLPGVQGSVEAVRSRSANDQLESSVVEDPPATTTKMLTPEMELLRDRIRETLKFYYKQHLNTKDHSPWAIMHSFITYGVDTQLYIDRPNGKRVSAIGWLCYNGRSGGMRLFQLKNGQIYARQGPGYQGHGGQFLAMLAQSRVKMDYPLKIMSKDFTVSDLIKYEQDTCRSKTELTFKLIGLSHYLPSDAKWENRHGYQWDIPRLIREEMAQPVNGAACGGTHRLMGLSYAFTKREKRNEPIDGDWLRARKFVEKYQQHAFQNQNRDGSFSTNWFRGAGNRTDVNRKLETTGHILEWMVYSLPQDQLDQPRVVKAVDFLTQMMVDNRYRHWKVGPKGHALHALLLYDQRVFGTTSDKSTQRYAVQVLDPAQDLAVRPPLEPVAQAQSPTAGSSSSANLEKPAFVKRQKVPRLFVPQQMRIFRR